MALPSDTLLFHRRVLISAAVRAGYAHTCRYEEPAARREIARMTGVVMSVCGPGRGPTTPSMLIDALHRPLEEIAPELFSDVAVRGLTILQNGDLSDDVYSEGCEDIVELLSGGVDPARGWLPTWAWMHAELVENEAFRRINEGANEDEYTAHRYFVVKNPAGAERQLAQLFAEAVGMRKSVRYVPIPADQVFRDKYWWPCPVCQWPMHVDEFEVRCRFPLHDAVYFVRRDSSKGRPLLQPRDGDVPRQPAARVFLREGPDRSMCVETAVWRHIVISGVSEVYLFERLDRLRLHGVHVEIWPNKDRIDLLVKVPATGWVKTLDVKDYASAVSLADKICQKPLAARTIVIPDYRGEAQRDELTALLPNMEVLLVSEVISQVKAQIRKAKRQ
ncbi:hypothetical protein GCM10010425_20020 [Streptomyces spororaveus]|uniref:REase associating with pPIWI RE domain-containing protein n=1 Tax=Streptomyces spororaveus TaxID=284039 RepID=A0ABQ3T8K6_9ACTN|nr:hypothetical protein [Streptomyces spororaveus]GHI76305.1 hypothetical protein Sspor_18660 [Streptomyces spororaveus]